LLRRIELLPLFAKHLLADLGMLEESLRIKLAAAAPALLHLGWLISVRLGLLLFWLLVESELSVLHWFTCWCIG
jgi:hypothetical protein